MVSASVIVVCAWMAWCCFNVALLFLGSWLVMGQEVATNGFTVVMPERIRAMLTDEEAAAVIAHEHGHIAHRHSLLNTARACLFIPRSELQAFTQELEADDYAAARGHGLALASALRKLSTETRDLYRAQRLAGL